MIGMQTMILISSEELSEIITKAVEAGLKNSAYYSQSIDDSGLLTREEAAAYLNVTPTSISKYVNQGKIEAGGTPRKYLFKKSELDKFIFRSNCRES